MLIICLKSLLEQRSMTQKELCLMIHARPSTISALCNNHAVTIKLQLLHDICKALGCELSDIIKIM